MPGRCGGHPWKGMSAMTGKKEKLARRGFLRFSGLMTAGSVLTGAAASLNSKFKDDRLQVWSCGGLSEAFIAANRFYEQLRGCHIVYTGAYAGALGKSLLGDATTDLFAARSVELARKLKTQGKMLYFVPLCFTKYVLITPRGNPGGI